MNWSPGDACLFTQFFGFLYDPSGGHEHPPGDARNFGSILMFLRFWLFLSRKKGSLYDNGRLDIDNCCDAK